MAVAEDHVIFSIAFGEYAVLTAALHTHILAVSHVQHVLHLDFFIAD